MQWSQIKTLFILAFLILNVFLLIQFYDKQKEADLGTLEPEESTLDERLANENISIPKLPKEQAKEPFISVRQRVFSEEELDLFDQIDKQEVTLINKNFIISMLDKPIKIAKDASSKAIEELVKEQVAFPEEYMYWDWNKEVNVLIFFQQKNDRPVYFNQNGMILVFLNDQNEMVFYTQTMLGDTESHQDKQLLIKPIKAIETLYNARELHSGDSVTKVEIGFHTRVPLASGVQVFVPTWKVTVNEDRNYFVNAIEGFIFSSYELDFLAETIIHDIEKLETSMVGELGLKDLLLSLLSEKLEIINWGGVE